MILQFMPIDAHSPPPVAILAPPLRNTPSDPRAAKGSPEARFWIWTPGAASCSDQPLDLTGLEPPEPTSMPWTDVPATVTFKIDANGKPYSIRPQVRESGVAYGYRTLSPWLDLEPSLAASRFPAKAPQDQCSINFTLRSIEFSEATLGEKLEWATSLEGSLNDNLALVQLLAGASDCNEQVYPRVVYYPAFDQEPSRAGHNGKILNIFDIDRGGMPINIRTAYSSATPAANKMANVAIGKSRFAPKAGKSCLRIDFQSPGSVIAAPDAVDPSPYQPKDSNCPGDGNSLLDVSPVPYPEGFQRRAIEGWAIVSFDTVPRRGVTHAKALRAEPADAFGVQAEQVVQAAKPRSGDKALHGCVAKVVFKLPGVGPYGVFNGVR